MSQTTIQWDLSKEVGGWTIRCDILTSSKEIYSLGSHALRLEDVQALLCNFPSTYPLTEEQYMKEWQALSEGTDGGMYSRLKRRPSGNRRSGKSPSKESSTYQSGTLF